MHTIDIIILHNNIDLWSEPILFYQLALVELVDNIINLCCPNMDHDSSYLGALACTDLGSWRILDRVASLIMISSHGMSAINFHDIFWHHPPELWVGCVGFYTQTP